MAELGLFLSNYPAHRRLLQLARQLYSLQKQTMIPGVNSSTLRWWYHSYRKWCF